MDTRQLGPQEKLRIKQFFQQRDARQYVRSFVAQNFSSDVTPKVFPPNGESQTEIQMPMESPIVADPSLLVELTKGSAFEEFHKSAIKTTIQVSIDIFGRAFAFKNIQAAQCPVISQTIVSPLPGKLDAMVCKNTPLRLCVSTTSPDISFVGLGYCDWRKVITEGLTSVSVELIGLQNEIVGVIKMNLKLIGFDEKVNFSQYKELYDLQLRQEALDKIENERQFAVKLKIWWRELQALINDKSFTIASNELGSNSSTVFDSITPFYSRSLLTPGHCLRFAYLMTPIIAPTNISNLPNWAVVASRCASERERLNLLVSMLRGFGFRAFVVVAKPRSFAVSYSSSLIYFDVNQGKFSSKVPPKTQTVSFMYNESCLYANLNPADPVEKLEWDVDNPLRWKMLEVTKSPKDNMRPAIIETSDEEIDELEIEMKTKEIIEQHRNSVGLFTKWNSELPPVMLPIIDSCETEKITGQTLGIHSMASEAIGMSIKRFHAVRVAFAVTNTTMPTAIFKSLIKTKRGMEILGAKDDDASFVLIIRCTKYPNGLVATWALLAIDSVSPLAAAPQ